MEKRPGILSLWPGKGQWDPDRYVIKGEIDDETALYYVDDNVKWTGQISLAVQYAEEISAIMDAQRLAESTDDGVQFRVITCEKIPDEEKDPKMFYEYYYEIRQIHYFMAIEQAKRNIEIREKNQAEKIEKQEQRDKIKAAKLLPKNAWWR